jgi:serine/threonine-protein kinase
VLNPDLQDSEVMKRFRAEATTLARLNHPEIATIHEIHRSDTDLLMVMELVRGETLDQLSQRSGALPPERAAYLVGQVLGALGHAHKAGIVHRDLKPANIMVTDLGGIKIMDFGIARVAGAEHLTSDGLIMGTPAYMAPEQVLSKDLDGRADLYSCGVVFYRLLTGALPFQSDTAIGMVQKQLTEMPTPPRTYRADLPAWCSTILDRALAKDPADRYQTAEEFRSALMAAIGNVATEHTGAYAAAHLSGAVPAVAHQPVATPVPAPAAVPVPVPAAAPVAPPGSPAAPAARAAAAAPGKPATDGATVTLKRNQLAMGGALLGALAIGVAVLAYVALRPPAAAPAAEAETAQAGPPAAPPEAAALSTPPVAPATAPAAAATPATGATGVAPAAPPAKAPARATTPARPVSKAAAPPPSPAPAPATKAPALPPFLFDAKAVVADGDKNRERDAKAVIADGHITVTEKNDKVIASIPVDTIVGITYSNSRQPRWNSPAGPADVLKVEGGAFGFLKGGRNWIALRTKDTSLVLRVDDADTRRTITALEERTGHTVDRVVEKKD